MTETKRFVVCTACRSQTPELFPTKSKQEPTQGYGICSRFYLGDDGIWKLRGGYGSTVTDTTETTWCIEDEYVNEFNEYSLVCDECIKKWIAQHKLYRENTNRTCLICRKYPESFRATYDEVSIHRDYPNQDVLLYYCPDGKEFTMITNDYKYYQSISEAQGMWICSTCFTSLQNGEVKNTSLTTPGKIMIQACQFCPREFEKSTWYKNCNTVITLETLNDQLTIAEGKKYVTIPPKYACNECVANLKKLNIL